MIFFLVFCPFLNSDYFLIILGVFNSLEDWYDSSITFLYIYFYKD